MNVLFVHHGDVIGGAPRSLAGLIKALQAEESVQISLACRSEAMRDFFVKQLKIAVQDWPDAQIFFGKVIIGWSRVNTLKALWLFAKSVLFFPWSVLAQVRCLKKIDPDIVHLNSAVMITTGIAAKILGKKLVWHVREATVAPHSSGRFIRFLADKVICISEVEAAAVGAEPGGKVRVVYNPVDFKIFDPTAYDPAEEKRKLGFPSGTKLVLSLGGINPRKGALEFIEALQYCDSSTCAVIAGPCLGPARKNSWGAVLKRVLGAVDAYGEKVDQAMSRFSIDRIRLVGVVEDVSSLIAASDVLVFAAKGPHFARPVFEAWAMKKPVVVFDMLGVSNQVEDGINGVVVRELTGKALGEALRGLLNQPALCRKMGEEGYQRALKKMMPSEGARKVQEIYHEILSADSITEAKR